MPKAPRRDRQPLLVGGLNFKTGKSTPLRVSKTAPIDDKSESDHQVSFFAVLRMNQPRPRVTQRRTQGRVNAPSRIIVEEDLTDPQYLNHPLYILTRVRHFPNGGLRHAVVAQQLAKEGVRKGAFDICLDAARRSFNGFRMEFKAEGGELSPEQIEERRWLKKEHYAVHVVWHYLEALALLAWYCDFPLQALRGVPTTKHAVSLPATGHDEKCGCPLKLDLRKKYGLIDE